MNTQLFVYALEVQKTGSITQAAGNMFMSQPTLSKAIKELEASLGFPVFERSSKGVVPTQKGQEFLLHAKRIVEQMRRMEQSLAAQDGPCLHFGAAIPRVGYIAQAAAQLVCEFDGSRRMEFEILETSSAQAVESVAYGRFPLGVVRCPLEDEAHCIRGLEAKGLRHELLWRGEYVALMRADHPAAKLAMPAAGDFLPYIEVTFGDEEVQRPESGVGDAQTAHGSRRILVYSSAMQLDIIRNNPQAYMWGSPMPRELLAAGGLVQRSCAHSGGFADLLISKNGYYFSDIDRAFIDKLCLLRNRAAYHTHNIPK